MSLPTIHVIDFEGDTSRGIVEWGVATIKDGKIINFECDICSNIDDSEYDVLFGMSSGEFYCNPNFLDINVPNIDLKDAPKFDIEKMRDVFNSLSKNLDKLYNAGFDLFGNKITEENSSISHEKIVSIDHCENEINDYDYDSDDYDSDDVDSDDDCAMYSFDHFIPKFIEFRKSGIFAAQGSGFDNRLIRMYKKTPGIVPDFSKCNDVKKLEKVSQWGPWLDTYKIIKKYYQNLGDYSVEAVVKKLKLNSLVRKYAKNFNLEKEMQIFHCAGYDALAEAAILCSIIDMFNITSIEELLC